MKNGDIKTKVRELIGLSVEPWLDKIGAQRRRYTFLFFANCFASRIAAIMLDGFAIPFPAMS